VAPGGHEMGKVDFWSNQRWWMVSKLEDRIFVNILGFANNISGSWIVQKYSV